MNAPQLPALPGSGGSDTPPPKSIQYSKRGKITIVACVSCRRRKTKCDGRRPICSQCQGRSGTCHYDMSEEHRRLTFLRENVEHLAVEKNTLESLISSLRSDSVEEALEVLRRLRSGAEPYVLAQQIQASQSLAQVRLDSSSSHRQPSSSSDRSSPKASTDELGDVSSHERLIQYLARSSSPEVEEIVRRLRLHEDVDSILSAIYAGSLLRPFGNFVLNEGFPLEHRSLVMHDRPAAGYEGRELRNHHLRSWTSVTDDGDFIEHLISTYFAWQHSFFQSFPERLFWSDIRTGGTKYCSKFLVNAMCAVGCLLSDRPESRQDPDDPRTAGIDFYEEALRLQAENTTSDVTTVAGLVLLSHLDGHRGRLSLMWSYCGQSARMALDLGLHLRKDKPLGEQQKQQQWSEAVVSETMVRNQVFWGAFIADQLVSFTLGRLPQIPTSAVTVDMPQVREGEDGDMWMPPNPHLRARSPASISTVFYEVARLSKILNSTLLMFFAPTEAIKGSLLLDEYNKYLAWYHRLPTAVASLEDAPPHILTLHMYYHAAILLLFRPFLKATLTNSPISPSEICRTAANYISDIAMRYRRQYGVAGLHAFQPHCLVAACTIHIVNMPSIASTSYLKAACEILQEMTFRNEWALGGLGMLRAIVRKWGIILPGDVEEALYGPGAADADADPPWTASVDDRMDVDSTTPTVEAQRARGKRPIYRGLLAAEMPKHTKLAVPRGLGSLMNESSGESATTSATSGSSSIRSRGTEQVNPSGAGAGSPGNTNYLFTPFPSQPAPLLMPIHTSTAGGESEVVIQELEGLNFEGNDWFDQFLGYSGEE